MSTHDSDHPHDDRLTSVYAALVDDLATVLDLTSGADEATHPATYDILTADLATELHLDAGLTAIIGGHTPSAPSPRGSIPATSSTPSSRRLADRLKSLTDLERLRLRALPSYCKLRGVVALIPNLDLAYELACTLDHAHNLVHPYARTGDLALDRAAAAHDLVPAFDRARDLGQALDSARDLGHALDRAYARDLAHAQACDLAAARDLARDREIARNLALNLAHAHARAHARVHALVQALAFATPLVTAVAGALARRVARTLARNLTRTLARDLDRARNLAHTLVRNRDDTLDRARNLARDLACDLDLDLDLTSIGITNMLEDLIEIADNFVGADLRAAVDFDRTEWDGVRWSAATRWPPGWEQYVRVISVKTAEPGIFLVDRNGLHSLHESGT